MRGCLGLAPLPDEGVQPSLVPVILPLLGLSWGLRVTDASALGPREGWLPVAPSASCAKLLSDAAVPWVVFPCAFSVSLAENQDDPPCWGGAGADSSGCWMVWGEGWLGNRNHPSPSRKLSSGPLTSALACYCLHPSGRLARPLSLPFCCSRHSGAPWRAASRVLTPTKSPAPHSWGDPPPGSVPGLAWSRPREAGGQRERMWPQPPPLAWPGRRRERPGGCLRAAGPASALLPSCPRPPGPWGLPKSCDASGEGSGWGLVLEGSPRSSSHLCRAGWGLIQPKPVGALCWAPLGSLSPSS